MSVEVDTKQLRSAAARLRSIEGPLAESNQKVANGLEAQWKSLVSASASTRLERRVIASTARAVVVENGIRLEAGKGGGALRGGLSIARAAGPVEYGANRQKRKTYRRKSRNGGSHEVTRRTAAQFRDFNRTGHVFAPAVKKMVPKLIKGWFEGLKVVVSDSIQGS